MTNTSIYQDIATRTGGDIYIGVVGPVRTGKSTLIKRIIELMILPNMNDPNERERTKDEMPQSGGGKTIMTTEPKFIPDESTEIIVGNGIKFNMRLVDCVGYAVEGALGYEEEQGPRMVTTPWFDSEVPFQEAAELGTRKVIAEHSTIGLVVTTDGTISDIPRANYIEAEEKVVGELKELGKPFVIVLNSSCPEQQSTLDMAAQLAEKYDAPVLPLDNSELTQEDIFNLLEEVLYEFPVNEVNIQLPVWIDNLAPKNWLKTSLERSVRSVIGQVKRLRDVDNILEELAEDTNVEGVNLENMNLGNGTATIDLIVGDELYYQVLDEETGFKITDRHELLELLRRLRIAKYEYDKLESALKEVKETGYGVVPPSLEEMDLEEPELIKQGGRFGIKLKASAPSLHIIRADVSTEITPIIGTEKQCEELVSHLLSKFEDDPQQLWASEIFGKSLNDLVKEGVQNKLQRMPEGAQNKLQETLQRIVNDGSGGLICIII